MEPMGSEVLAWIRRSGIMKTVERVGTGPAAAQVQQVQLQQAHASRRTPQQRQLRRWRFHAFRYTSRGGARADRVLRVAAGPRDRRRRVGGGRGRDYAATACRGAGWGGQRRGDAAARERRAGRRVPVAIAAEAWVPPTVAARPSRRRNGSTRARPVVAPRGAAVAGLRRWGSTAAPFSTASASTSASVTAAATRGAAGRFAG
eukprot:gene11401-biopygen1306